jgi:hypothetical protein
MRESGIGIVGYNVYSGGRAASSVVARAAVDAACAEVS